MEKTLLYSFNMLFVWFISTLPLYANDSDTLLERIDELRKSNPDRALHLAAEFRQNIDNVSNAQKAEFYYIEGKIYKTGLLDREQAIISFYNALKYYRLDKNRLQEHKTLAYLARCFEELEHYPLAIEYGQEAIAVPDIEAKYILRAKYNLGRALGFDEQYQESQILLTELCEAYTQLNNTKWLLLSQAALALNYLNAKEYDKSTQLYKLVLNTADSIQNYRELVGKSISSLGYIELEKKNYSKAEEYLIEALNIKKGTSDQQTLLMTYLNLGRVYHETNQLVKAVQYFQLAISLQPEKVNVTDFIDALRDLSSIATQKSDLETALFYTNRIIALQNPLVELSQRLQVRHKRYKAERAKYMFEEWQLSQELIQAKSTRNVILVVFSIGLFIALVIVVFQNRNLRVKNSLIPKLRSKGQMLNYVESKYNLDLKSLSEELERSGRSIQE